jgi:hypothetical protein
MWPLARLRPRIPFGSEPNNWRRSGHSLPQRHTRCLTQRRLGKMELAIALSFSLRPDEAIVSRTISMIPPDRREEWIIRQARERPAAERAVFLDGACAGDEAMRQRLEARLAAHDQPETLLASQADTARPAIKLDLAQERSTGLASAEKQSRFRGGGGPAPAAGPDRSRLLTL